MFYAIFPKISENITPLKKLFIHVPNKSELDLILVCNGHIKGAKKSSKILEFYKVADNVFILFAYCSL